MTCREVGEDGIVIADWGELIATGLYGLAEDEVRRGLVTDGEPLS